MINNLKKQILDVCLLLIGYFLFHNILFHSMRRLTEESFINSPSLIIAGLNSISLILFTIFILVLLLPRYKLFEWNNFDNINIKYFIFILCFAIFWEASFLEMNYYYNYDFTIDKILLVISAFLILKNGIFAFIFLLFSLLMFYSTQFPLGSMVWTGIRPAYEILMLFIVFMIVKRFRGVHTNIFILLAITLHAANYFIPGIAKIEISPNGWEWTFKNELNNLFISSYVNGWIGFLSEELIISIAQVLDKTEVLVTVGTMIIQLGALFLLYTKRISIVFFIGFELLHLGIFFASGIFFWAWIIVNLGFIYLVKKLPKESLEFLYSKQTFGVFIAVVLLSPLVYKPIALGWWDARVNTIYDFYATTENDEKIRLNRNDFSPYDTIFTQNRLYYLSDEKVATNTYGVIQRDEMLYGNLFSTLINYVAKPILGREPSQYKNDSYELYLKLEEARNIDDVKNITQQYGINYFDEEKKENLREFVKTYFENYNKVEQKHSWYHKLGAPYHIYDLSAKRLKGWERIKKVEVYKTNTWWNKKEGKIVRFGEEKVMEVEIETN